MGKIGTLGFHLGEDAVQGGDLGDDLFVFGALKLDRQFIDTPLDLRARELLRQYELDRHRRCISQHRAEGQARRLVLFLLSRLPRDRDSVREPDLSFRKIKVQDLTPMISQDLTPMISVEKPTKPETSRFKT